MTPARETELDARSMMTQEERFFTAKADHMSNITVAAARQARRDHKLTGCNIYQRYDELVMKWTLRTVDKSTVLSGLVAALSAMWACRFFMPVLM